MGDRSRAISVSYMNIGATLEQKLDCVLLRVGDCQQERGIAYAVSGIDVCAIVQQKLNDFCVARLRGIMERGIGGLIGLFPAEILPI